MGVDLLLLVGLVALWRAILRPLPTRLPMSAGAASPATMPGGPGASEAIHEVVLAIKTRTTIDVLADIERCDFQHACMQQWPRGPQNSRGDECQRGQAARGTTTHHRERV